MRQHEGLNRYILVKGQNGGDGTVMPSENELNRLAGLGVFSLLYIVPVGAESPKLFRLQSPAKNLVFEKKSKGVQYFLPMAEWKNKEIE